MYIPELAFEIAKFAIPIVITIILFGFSHRKAKKALQEAVNANTIATDERDIMEKQLALLREEFDYKKEEGRPYIELKNVMFDTDEIDIYVGSNIHGWEGAKNIEEIEIDPKTKEKSGYDYASVAKNPKRLYKNTLYSHKGKQYMLLNLLPPNTESLENAVLIFGVLKLVIDLKSKSAIKEFKIEKSYSVKSGKPYGKGIQIDFNYLDPKPTSEILIAYVFDIDSETSVYRDNI